MENPDNHINSGITPDTPTTLELVNRDMSGPAESSSLQDTKTITHSLNDLKGHHETTIWYNGSYESAQSKSADEVVTMTSKGGHTHSEGQQEQVDVDTQASSVQPHTTLTVVRKTTTTHFQTYVASLTGSASIHSQPNATIFNSVHDVITTSVEATAEHSEGHANSLSDATIAYLEEPTTSLGHTTAHKQAAVTESPDGGQTILPNEEYDRNNLIPFAIMALCGVFFLGYVVAVFYICFRQHRQAAKQSRTRAQARPVTFREQARLSMSSEVWPDLDEIVNAGTFVVGDSGSDYGSHDDEKDAEPKPSRSTYKESIALQALEGRPPVRRGTQEELASVEEYELPAFSNPHQSRMSMRLRKLDKENWITLGRDYSDFYAAKLQLLKDHPNQVIKYQDNAPVMVACQELLEMVIETLCSKHQTLFHTDGSHVSNNITKELFNITDGSNHPLKVAAMLAMEDFNILMVDPGQGSEHRLVASATFFPAGWRLEERFGWTVTQLHNPVPGWGTTLATSVEKYLTSLTPEKSMERFAYFIQLNQKGSNLASILFTEESDSFFPEATIRNLTPQDILVRRERQTFQRLPKSDAVVFTVHTSLTCLVDFDPQQLSGLAEEIRGWDENMAEYKRRDIWGDCLLEFCDRTVKIVDI